MRNLSKSKIIAFRQCPKRLWLEIHKPELRDDSASQAAFAIGNEVGEIARQVFDPQGTGDFIDINDLGHTEAIARSATLLEQGNGPTFFDAEGAAGELAGYGFPAYFLEFETISFAVPRWEGTRHTRLFTENACSKQSMSLQKFIQSTAAFQSLTDS